MEKVHNPWMDCNFECSKMGEKNKEWCWKWVVRENGKNGKMGMAF
jgi:hypothetical protein